MFTKTITLKGSRHQIVLGYKSMETMTSAMREAPITPDSDHIRLKDDFGQTAYYTQDNLVSVVVTDLDAHEDLRVARSIAEARAQSAFQTALGQDPTLGFLVGGVKPGLVP
jgi:hypothetical protein